MSEILTSDLTEGIITGEGVFDELQKAFHDNIQSEYKKNRILGAEYSQVYLGGMQAAMQNAVTFILGRQKADAEAELIKEKILTEALIREKLQAEIDLLGKSLEEMEAKVWIAKAQISDDLTITEAPVDFIGQGILGRQAEKLDNEKALLSSKNQTEKAQTEDIAVPESVVGKEILLRQRQADGFLRDAEQKLSKIVADSYSVQFTTMDGLDDIPDEFNINGINAILGKARIGIEA